MVFDLTARTRLKEIPVGQRPYGVAASDDGCFVAVANIDSDDVTLIDTRRLERITTLPRISWTI